MMKFPDRTYNDAKQYAGDYFAALSAVAKAIELSGVARAADLVARVFENDRTLFACGNGGSAAISNHLLCDFAKGIQADTALKPRVVSLSSHVELITAIGNDIAFEEIFAYQLRTSARAGDLLLSVSSSGNSENIVRAVAWAGENGVDTIAMTGFEGGRSAKIADVNLHVPAANYGVVEDLHQSLMHILAQFVRLRHMQSSLVGKRAF